MEDLNLYLKDVLAERELTPIYTSPSRALRLSRVNSFVYQCSIF